MKLTVPKFLPSAMEQCLDWASPLSALFNLVVLMLLLLVLALACRTLIEPIDWWHRLRPVRNHERDDSSQSGGDL